MFRKAVLLCLLLSRVLISYGQLDSIDLHVKSYVVAGTDGFAPHWIVSNRYGIFSDSTNDFILMPGFTLPLQFGKHLHFNSGFDFVLRPEIKTSFIYQGYVNVSWGKLKVMAGRQEYTIGQYSTSLSSGSFIVSNNALPIPRIGIGFYDFTDVPLTHGYLQVKGAFNHGWLDGNRLDHSPYNKPLLLETYGYIRTRKLPVNVGLGLVHFAMYGGEDANGNKVPKHFLDVLLFRHVSSGGEINAYGEHLGMVDMNASAEVKNYELTYYYQIPITDRTGIENNFSRNKDFFMGLLVETKKHNLVSGFTYEFNHTTQQGGDGLPDPVVDGQIREPWDPADREYLKEYYTALGYPVSNLNTTKEWQSFLQAYTNYGYLFGGRVDYYNNYQYKDIYLDKIIGTSLFTTRPQLKRMTGYEDDIGDYVVNNRVLIHHLGLEGYFGKSLDYRLLMTFTRNIGQWQEYGGRYQWEGLATDPDYTWYWEGARIQWYSMMEIGYQNVNLRNFRFRLGAGYDFGEIYHNFGFLAGIEYNYRLKF